MWGEYEGVEELPLAPKFDGHTASDALERLAKLFHSAEEGE